MSDLNLTFVRDELQSYTTARTQKISPKSHQWIVKSADIFWENTCGVISQTTLKKLYNSILANYSSHDSWGKLLNFAKSFLKYLAKLHLDTRYLNFTLFLDMPKTRRERKSVTPRIVTKEDITHVLDRLFAAYHGQHLKYESMVNYVAFTLLGAYTGQRVEATLSKITVIQLKAALHANPPVLHVTSNQDKILMEHYVPIHPDLLDILRELTEGKKDNACAFEFVGYQMWLKRNKIPLSRVPAKKFIPSDVRKFAEQYGDIIQWNQTNRAYILTHGVSGIDWSHYKHPLPEYVYANYMQYWDFVHLLEKAMPREITRTGGLNVSQRSAGLA